MTGKLGSVLRCEKAASAAEFALVLPLMLILLFGTIDVGQFLWAMNRAEKATQMGARYAIVTDPVSTELVDADFESADLPRGELIPADMLGNLECTRATCTCTACEIDVGPGVNTASFDGIVARMQAMYPDIEADDVRVAYRGSGFGSAGDTGGTETMEISPLVTVSLTGLQFVPITTLLFADITLPAFSTTLPAEDASGAVSN